MNKSKLPTKQQILDYLNNGGLFRKKEMANNLDVPNNCRAEFRRMLQQMERDGEVDAFIKKQTKTQREITHTVNTVDTFTVTEMTDDGELLCMPVDFKGKQQIEFYVESKSPVQIGDKILARTIKQQENIYICKVIKVISDNEDRIIGILQTTKDGFNLISSDRKDRNIYTVEKSDAMDCQHEDMVIATAVKGKKRLEKKATVVERIGSINDSKCYSLLAIAKYDMPFEFPEEVENETIDIEVPKLGNRTDLRDIPLVTIDGADARDFDDAVYAEKTDNGFKLLIAIADVSNYVKTNSELDKEAYKRGNSVYFPDRVVPMLPEKLSNGLCSLVPNEERACMAVWINIDNNGEMIDYQFIRGLMKSHARLTYEQVQSAIDTQPCETTEPVMEQINTLYGAYSALSKARKNRNTLELDIAENQVFMDENGRVEKIQPRVRLDSHKLIEELMISANVASALALEKKKQTHIMYRVHDLPPADKLESLNTAIEEFKMKVPMDGSIKPMHFSKILSKVKDTEYSGFVSDVVLRSQSQALYTPDNLGHFGLALSHYCHFTSPIRRYSDLLVHRALINAYKFGDDGLEKSQKDKFEEIAEHISITERNAQRAERETMDKYLATFMSHQVGATFRAKVSGVNEFAMFVRVEETGAEGVIMLKRMKDDFYIYNQKTHSISGRRKRKSYRMGDYIDVVLEQVTPVKGGLEFSIAGNSNDKSHRNEPKYRKKPQSKHNNRGKNGKKPRSNKSRR
ncbi:MAG: ribonuclease R [Alphaproteobacteria bacterium]